MPGISPRVNRRPRTFRAPRSSENESLKARSNHGRNDHAKRIGNTARMNQHHEHKTNPLDNSRSDCPEYPYSYNMEQHAFSRWTQSRSGTNLERIEHCASGTSHRPKGAKLT